jgi:hypothetical protein
MRYQILAVCAAAVVGGMASVGSAATVSVVNGNFDQMYTDTSMTTPVAFGDGSYSDGVGSTYAYGPNQWVYVPGWVDNPHNGWAAGVSPMNGKYTAYFDSKTSPSTGPTLSQVLSTNVAAGQTYQLNFTAAKLSFDPADFTPQLTANLLAGGTPLTADSSTTLAMTDTNWNDFSLTFTAGAGIDTSSPLEILFSLPANAGGTYENSRQGVLITNVTLDSVPEPTSLVILGAGSLGLMAVRRRRPQA